MSTPPVTLDFSKAQPVNQGVQLDFSKAQPISTDPSVTGQVTNDVGNQVTVPKDGESFSDTMDRAIQHGKQLVNKGNLTEQGKQEVGKEMQTAPEKAGLAILAAPSIGAAGSMALAGAGELGAAASEGAGALYDLAVKHLAGEVLPGMEEAAAKAKLIEYAPKVLKVVRDLGLSAGGSSLIWKAIFGGKK